MLPFRTLKALFKHGKIDFDPGKNPSLNQTAWHLLEMLFRMEAEFEVPCSLEQIFTNIRILLFFKFYKLSQRNS